MVHRRKAQLLGRLVEQREPFVAQDFLGPALGLFPGRKCPLEQSFPSGGQAERLRPGILAGDDFQPIFNSHPLDVAAERGCVHLKDVADLAGLGEAKFRRYNQDVQLAHFQAQRAQGLVVQARDDPIQQAQAQGDATPGNVVYHPGRSVHGRGAPLLPQ